MASPARVSVPVDAPPPAPVFNMEQANANRQYLAQILATLNQNAAGLRPGATRVA